jgi:hypothetical protein
LSALSKNKADFTHLDIDFLQLGAMSAESGQSVIVDVVAALRNEALQLPAAVTQGPDPVAGDQVAPGDVQVKEVGAALRLEWILSISFGRNLRIKLLKSTLHNSFMTF